MVLTSFGCSDYTGSITYTDCTGTHSIVWGHCWHGGSREHREAQKKNPFLLAGYLPLIPIIVGRTQKKKESFKKASQVVISRVGIIES